MEKLSRIAYLAALPRKSGADAPGIDAAFPNVDPGNWPFGSRVMVQLRLTARKTRAGIVLPGESQDAEKWNTGIAQVIGMGPLAFKKRDSLQPWPEGTWCEVGDFVRVPKFGGERWEVAIDDVEGADDRSARAAELDRELLTTAHGARRDTIEREREMLSRPLPPILVMFAIFNDTEMIAAVIGNPVLQRVYI
jgi:co-chaperonin GroES (HSP10)